MKKILYFVTFLFTLNTAIANDVIVENPIVRLMPLNVKTTAGYFELSNKSDVEETLIGAKSNSFKNIEIHESKKDGDVMQMLKRNSVSIKSKSNIKFMPMGLHLMLMNPIKQIEENQEISITLIFESGKNLDINFLVKKMDEMKMPKMDMENDSQCSDMDMGEMKMGNMMTNMSRPDFVFPVGVKGGKNMMAKRIMFSYKFGTMDMDCCKDSTSSVNNDFIKSLGFSMAPTDMTMDMHMFHAMYAYNKNISLMAMLPYIEKEMDMVKLSGMNSGRTHRSSSRGIGDLSIAGLYKLSGKSNLKLSLSIPTGEFDEKDENMMGMMKILPYPMQLGSGTYDVTLCYSFQEIFSDWSYGFQLNATKRFDYNSEDWRYGDRREVSAWAAKPLFKTFSFSIGLDIEHQDNINGKSSKRNNMTPTWNEYFHSHLRVSSNIGLNYKIPNSKSRIGLQCGVPIYEDVDGSQMVPDFKCNLGFSSMM